MTRNLTKIDIRFFRLNICCFRVYYVEYKRYQSREKYPLGRTTVCRHDT